MLEIDRLGLVTRKISLWGRKRDAEKDCRRVLQRFSDWRSQQDGLAPPSTRCKTLLLIRLDDIGDYLLFRNQLEVYKQSTRWSGYKITLLGHEAWRDLFMRLDAASVDDGIWVNKNRYLDSPDYRFGIWEQLRGRGFEVVIAPSSTRPLLLDDLCMLAAAPQRSLGCLNSNVHAAWNEQSNALYTSLFKPSAALLHEFSFNAEFAEWAAGVRVTGGRPRIALSLAARPSSSYILCFVGASTRSRRWPVKRWLQFVADYRKSSSSEIVFAGNSKTELEMVRIIQQSTDVRSIAGTVTLTELLPWVAGARAVITNDTMAAHMGAILDRPTVIIANGVNYMRFSEYRNLNFVHVATVYPDVFNRHRRRVGDGLYAYSDTVSADIASISAASVRQALDSVIDDRARDISAP